MHQTKLFEVWHVCIDRVMVVQFLTLDKEFAALCTRPYWTRLWVIQEVVLGYEIYIHCGSMRISWDIFSSTVHNNPEARDDIFNSRARTLCNQRGTLGRLAALDLTNVTSLVTLSRIHREARCADVRDKIYGLRGLAPLCCQQAIPADYSCSSYQLCERLLTHEFASHPPEETFRAMQIAIRYLFALC